MNLIWTDTLLIAGVIIVLYLLLYGVIRFRKKDVSSLSSSTSWWSMGLFILSANIGFDYFVGGAGLGYTKGIAIGSYEWTGCVFMVVALLFVLPRMMSPGIKTTPEYLGYRFNQHVRKSVAVIMVLLQCFAVLIPAFYTGADSLRDLYGGSFEIWMMVIGLVLFAVLFTGRFDIIMRFNTILILVVFAAGIIFIIYCFKKMGGVAPLLKDADGRMNSVLPYEDDMLPWHSVFFGGLWVAHAYYWSFNQFIVQSVVQAKNLSQAQFAYLFAGTIKLAVPFLILLPGITAYVMYGNELAEPDEIFMMLMKVTVPPEISGKLLIAYLMAVVSTFSAIVYSCVTMTMNDLYPEEWVNEKNYIKNYRVTLLVIVLIALVGAYVFYLYKHIDLFKYNQYVMNLVTPALVAVFGMALFFKWVTARSAIAALVLTVPSFVIIRVLLPHLDLLNTGGIMFVLLCLVMYAVSKLFPESEIKEIPDRRNIKFERNIGVFIWCIFLLTAVFSIYVIL